MASTLADIYFELPEPYFVPSKKHEITPENVVLFEKQIEDENPVKAVGRGSRASDAGTRFKPKGD